MPQRNDSAPSIQIAPGVKQVGGYHYASTGISHWDLIEAADVDYLAATATKYICRFDKKGTPRQDLEKAKSYLERMMVAHRGTRRLVPFPLLQEFYKASGLDANKRRLLNLILEAGKEEDIVTACLTLSVMIARMPE